MARRNIVRPWHIEKYENFGEGIYRNYAIDDPDYPSGAMWDALNMRYEQDSDNVEKLGGSTLLGSAISGTPTITGLFDYDSGTQMVAMGTDGKGWKRTTGEWSAITGATGFDSSTSTRWAGSMAYGQTAASDLMVISNGVDAPQKYDGTTMSALGGSPPSTGKFFTPWMGHYWLASSSTLYYSVGDNCEDWSSAGSGQIAVALGWGGNITGIYPFAEHLFVFKRDKIFVLRPKESVNNVTVETVSPTLGAVGFSTIHDAGPTGVEYLMFMSDHGVESLTPTTSAGRFAVYNRTEMINSILNRRNRSSQGVSWAIFDMQNKEYHIYYPTGTKSVPSEGLIGNSARYSKPVRWTRNNYNGLTAGMVYLSSGQKIQVAGNDSGQVFQLDTGHARNGTDYRGGIYTKGYTQDTPSAMKRYNRYFVSTQTNGAYNVIVRPLLGRYLHTRVPGQYEYLTNPSADGWGVGTWGAAYWGGAATSGQWARLEKGNRGTYLRLIIETLGANQWWRLSGVEIESALAASTVRK